MLRASSLSRDAKEFRSDRKEMPLPPPPARPVNWDDLRLFLAVARCGSVARAAPQLGLSHPTVSRALSALERSLGHNLLLRSRSGFTLTPEGEALRDRAERIEAQVAAAVASNQTPIRITAGGWISRFLAQNMAVLLDDGPPLEIVNSYSFVDLATAEADIAIRHRRPERGYVVLRALPDLAFAVYGRPQFADIARPGAWQRAPWVTFDAAQMGFQSGRWLLREVPDLQPRLRCTQGVNIHDAVRAGVGIAVLPRFVGDADPALQRFSPSLAVDGGGLWLVVHEDRREAPRIAAVVERLVVLFHHHRRLFQPDD